ncbi:MAG: guanylate kinase [Bacteroidetes bacterium]|nr:guanylate kinase [Bacteroidota bacterium]
MGEGKLIILSAPSGSGKTTLMKHLLTQRPGLAFSVSATSRSKRAGEVHGVDYFFLDVSEFKEKTRQGDFLEWEEVYPDVFYGTLKSEVDKLIANGKQVVFDVDVVGGLNIKKHYGAKALAIFIRTPSLEILTQRLLARGTDGKESLQKRLDKAAWEMTFAPRFDLIIENDELEKAKVKLLDEVDLFIQGGWNQSTQTLLF